MSNAALLVAAVLAAVAGLAWLALAMDVHWHQVSGAASVPTRTQRGLRLFGSAALAVSFALCWAADHPTMAVLVWVMALAGAALAIAFVLSWRPRVLAPLAALARLAAGRGAGR